VFFAIYTEIMVSYFVLFMFCLLVVLIWLSVSVQVIDWKDFSRVTCDV